VAVTAQLQLAVRTPGGLSLDGAMPFEVETLADGFATPLFHLDGRSGLAWWGGSLGLDRAPGVEWGNGVAQLASSAAPAGPEVALPLTLTTLGAQLAGNLAGRRFVVRAWWPWPSAPPLGLTRAQPWPHLDAQGSALVFGSRHLAVRLSLLALTDADIYDDADGGGPGGADHALSQDRASTRAVLAEDYQRGPWTATFAQSVLFDADRTDRGLVQHHHDTRTSFGVRNQLRRTLREVGGLARLEVEVGAEANVTRHALSIADAADPHEDVATTGVVASDDVSHRFDGTIWTRDLGAWSSATAHLAADVRATTGLRVDAFGTDIAVQPRGALELDLAERLVGTLDAGAYRRAPEHGDELEHPDLHPERTTRIALGVQRIADLRGSGGFGGLEVYYLDRTNLVEDDGTGRLANTGRGTTYGVRGIAGVHADHWVAVAVVVLEHSDREATPRMRTRPFEYDQPVRFDARVTRFLGAWQVGAHFELRAGLPYTRVAGALYDADRDVYRPSFGALYAERLPWQHQLDLRVDRALGTHLHAYLDLANVYDRRAAIGWDYNFNFTQRRAVAAPGILPTLGIRGEL
ncbi:MAG: TonB-dependent receptor, partial [Kofleriaceae bacterium]